MMLTFDDLIKAFSGKRIFITGHTGFKGSWLSFLLAEVGAEVMGYSLPPQSSPNHFELLRLDKKINHVVGDICDRNSLVRALKDFQPEYVFHLAAQALVRDSYEDPSNTFHTNVIGSVNLLEAVRLCKSVRSLVYITSDKCYENVEWIWGYRESDRLGGIDPYSASKAAAEIIFSSYQRSFFSQNSLLGAASARAGNVIGGGDWAKDRIIPDCIRAIGSGDTIKIRNPSATRPWQHVLEPLSGYILLAMRLKDDPKRWSGEWNFGPSTKEVRTVREVVEKLIKHFGKGQIEIVDSSNLQHEANLLQLNCDKARQILAWHPRWNSSQTLEATALWYKAWMDGVSMQDITRGQINNFFEKSI